MRLILLCNFFLYDPSTSIIAVHDNFQEKPRISALSKRLLTLFAMDVCGKINAIKPGNPNLSSNFHRLCKLRNQTFFIVSSLYDNEKEWARIEERLTLSDIMVRI